MNVADALVEELLARGVGSIATLNGHGLDPLYLACQRAGMRVIDVRNEQAASYMAEVTGRLSRSVGVCAVSGAVAHANALTGVLNAWFDGAPMLLITGITPLNRLGHGDFQDFNPVPMAAPICKYARLLDAPELVGQIVHEAFAAATSGRPGPVHLSLPMDVASTEIQPDQLFRSRVRSAEVRLAGAGDAEQVRQAAEMIKRARQPVLVAGNGVYYARAEASLRQLAEQQDMPILVPIWDRGSVDRPTKAFMGVGGAYSGGPQLLPDADLVILAGAELDYRVGQLAPPTVRNDATVIRIHADESRLRKGVEADLSILGSPKTVLAQLAEACRQLGAPPATDWLREATRRKQEYREKCLTGADGLPAGTNGRDVIAAVRGVLTNETVLLVDGGNIGQWFHQLLTDRLPGQWMTCGASGVVGWGLPGAMASRVLYPDRPVILVSGDGSFTFMIAELECAARQGLSFVAVVADDRRWGISFTAHEEQFGRPLFSTLGETRLDQVAKGLGCHGSRVDHKNDLGPALRAALDADRPTVLHVPIVPSCPGK